MTDAVPMSLAEESLSLFYTAIYVGDMERVEEMLKGDDAAVLMRGNDWKPITLAARQGWKNMVELFLQHGAPVDDIDTRDGATALMEAAGYGCPETLLLLLKHGANLHAVDEVNMTALSWASGRKRKSAECARILLDHGAVIDHTWAGGWTALHYAASDGNEDGVNLLLERGARTDIKDNNGETAAIVARKREYQELGDAIDHFHEEREASLIREAERLEQEQVHAQAAQQLRRVRSLHGHKAVLRRRSP